ncbi:hypothetical protein NO2_0215 [Candidatus Termititenax persephonae]|uniref:DUF3800 domain-containing protein n=1 Tax=Candidatus Termititenax persephonae TaxID=2218525 RepID=A0A388TFL8_9BACT|nr:hypothetical protein NO2_0215 [Candidatus Termititenax persephonae]
MKYACFIDESGDHVLKIDKDYPIFVLCGVLLTKEEHDNRLTKLLNELKTKHFGRTTIILHTAEFLRPRSLNSVYYPLCDVNKRNDFYKDLENLIRNIDFKIIAISVSKPDYLADFKEVAQDPYLLSTKPLVKTVCLLHQELKLNEPIDFIAESRNNELDKQLMANYQYLNSSIPRIAEMVAFPNPVKKDKNVVGLQLADLVVTPIGRNLLDRKQYLNFDCIKSKLKLFKIPADWSRLKNIT